MSRQRTSDAIKKFSDDIRSFSGGMHSSLELLRRTIESGAHSGCHEFQEAFSEVEEEVADISNQLLQLELHVKEAISFEELLAHCAGVYDMNRKGLVQLESHLVQYGYRPQGPLQQPQDPTAGAAGADMSCAPDDVLRQTRDTLADADQDMDIDMYIDRAGILGKGPTSPSVKAKLVKATLAAGGDSVDFGGAGVGHHDLRGKKAAGISVAPATPHYVMSREAKAKLKARVKTPGLPLGRRLMDDDDDDEEDEDIDMDVDTKHTDSAQPANTNTYKEATGVITGVRASGVLHSQYQPVRQDSPLNEAKPRCAASPVQTAAAAGRKAAAAVATNQATSIVGTRGRAAVAAGTATAENSRKQRTPSGRGKGRSPAVKASPDASTPDAFDMSPSFAALQAKYGNRQQQSTGEKEGTKQQKQKTPLSSGINSTADQQEGTPLGDLPSFAPVNNRSYNNSMSSHNSASQSWGNTDASISMAVSNNGRSSGYMPEEDTCNLYQQLIRSKDVPTSLADANARGMARKQQAPVSGNSRLDPMRHSVQFPLQTGTCHDFGTNQENKKESHDIGVGGQQQGYDAGTGRSTVDDSDDMLGTPIKSSAEPTMTPTRLLRSRSAPRNRPDAALRASIGNADLAMRMEMLETTWVKSGQAALTPRKVSALLASPSRERIAQMVAQTTTALDGNTTRPSQSNAKKQLGELFNSSGTDSSGVASISDRVEGATPQLDASVAAKYGKIMNSSGAINCPTTSVTTHPPGIISTDNTLASFSFLGDTPTLATGSALPTKGCPAATNLTANFSPATAQLLGRVYGNATGSRGQSAAITDNSTAGTQGSSVATGLSSASHASAALPTSVLVPSTHAAASLKSFKAPSLAVEFSASLSDAQEIETPTLLKPNLSAKQPSSHITTNTSVQPSAQPVSIPIRNNKIQPAAAQVTAVASGSTAGNAANSKLITEVEYSGLPMYIRITLPFDKLSSFYATLCELSAGGGGGADMTRPEAFGLTGNAAKNLSSALTKLNKAKLTGNHLVAV